MRSSFRLILISLLLVSCSDGDLIVTSFDFEDGTLNLCGDTETKVFYNINNENINETLSFKTTRTAFKNSTEFKTYLEKNPGVSAITNDTINTITIPFSSANEVIYRTYDGEVSSSYFCNAIPPSTPKVISEYKSVPGDTDSYVAINTTISTSDDDDGDGVKNNKENKGSGQDTDGDGIQDYLDVDDDGDNVLTSTEIKKKVSDPVDENGDLDTDQDGTPNYLDDDDDGDTIKTKLEVTAADQFPVNNVNEANIAKYLDRYSTDEFDGTPDVIENKISVNYISTLTAKNIKLKKQGDNGEEISYTSLVLGTFTSSSIPVIITAPTQEPGETEPTPTN